MGTIAGYLIRDYLGPKRSNMYLKREISIPERYNQGTKRDNMGPRKEITALKDRLGPKRDNFGLNI